MHTGLIVLCVNKSAAGMIQTDSDFCRNKNRVGFSVSTLVIYSFIFHAMLCCYRFQARKEGVKRMCVARVLRSGPNGGRGLGPSTERMKILGRQIMLSGTIEAGS